MGARALGRHAPAGAVQHVELAAIAVAIGFVLASALAFAGFRFRLLDPPIGFLADFLYTIPSLALFQLLVPFTGVTQRPSRSRSSRTRS